MWGEIRHDDVLRILHNPCYAGAFVFGRTRTTKDIEGKTHVTSLPREEWQVVIHDAYAGYISWEAYERNLAQLAANSQAYAPQRLHPPREGPALLQGVVLCGRCGGRMTVRYHQRGGQRIVPDYLCQRAGIDRGEAPCQRMPGRDLDAAVSALLGEIVTPEMVERTLSIQDELVARAAEAERLRQLHVERAQYEAHLAQRRYLQVDPDNRLVANVLEAEWNGKLRALEDAREAAEQQRQQDHLHLTEMERQAMRNATNAFDRIWRDPRTPDRDRKRIIRLIIEDVTLHKTDCIQAQIRFKGGATHLLSVPLPPPFKQSRLTPPDTLAAIDRLLDAYTDAEVAKHLNAEGYRTFTGLVFEATHVSALRRKHNLKDRFTRLREAGWLTATEVATQLSVTAQTIWRWYRSGFIRGARYNDQGSCLFMPPDTRPSRKRSIKSKQRH